MNRRPVTSVEVFLSLTATMKAGEVVPVYLQRGGGGNNEYVVLKAVEPDKP